MWAINADYFMHSQDSAMNLLKGFLGSPSTMPNNTTHIHICLLYELYHDFSWLFS